ncbi:MAG: DegV family protein, partial [Clostridia bacterium]|nr:DegV family protein [Clostridia bacterium]
SDSTCDLSEDLLKKYDIAIAPLTVTLGERSGHDGIEITPDKITSGSNYKAWWICPDCGREWAAVVGSRSKGHGCPVCSKKKRAK